MISLIEEKRAELRTLCEKHRVQRLDLFGSALNGRFYPASSDLDFIVSFKASEERGYAIRFYNFAESLEALFQRKVDLLTEAMIGDPDFRNEVEHTRRIVYEQRSEQAFA